MLGNTARDATLKVSRELGAREIRDDHIYEGPQKGKYYIRTHEPLRGNLLWQMLTFHDPHEKKVDVTDAVSNR